MLPPPPVATDHSSVRLAIRRALGLFLIVAATAPAWGAVAIDQIKATDRSTSSTSITSPSFSTTAANELLLAFISSDGNSAGITATVSGAGLTWALVRRTNAQLGTAEIWRTFAPSTLANVTVTATLSQSVAASITVVTLTGTDTTGTSGSGAIGATASASASSGAPTASLVTTRNGSWVFGVGNDWDHATARTLGASQTMVHQYLAAVGDAYWVQRQNAATPSSGTTVTINDTAPTTDRYNLTIVEVLAGVGASPVPDLTVSKTHSGNFIQGQTGASYTITATNSGGAATSGTVTVTDTLPAGLTAAAMSGTNWACTLATLTCTRNDALAAGASYPAITLTVNVASTAPASVTNTATVAGGGETNTSNDTANDSTTITAAAGGLIHVGGASGHPTPNSSVYSLNYTPVGINNALVVLIGCRDSTVTDMTLTAPGWTLTPLSGLAGPSAAFDFIRTYGAITPNTTPVTFTVTLTGGGNCSGGDTTIMIDEFAGNDPTGGATTFDAHNESLDDGVIGICTGAPVTPVNNNDAIWYACYDNVTGVTSGYTKGQDDSTGDWTEYKILSGGAGVVQNPGFTTNPSFTSFGLGGVSIKAASGSGPTTYAVTGSATPASLANGANVVLSQGATTIVTTTIASGSYTFPSVANGTYTVTPSLTGVSFSPTSQSVTVASSPATVPAFTATAQTWQVSGSATPASLANGASVVLSQNTSTIATTTIASGAYTFPSVANGSYTVTPSLTGVSFSPTSQSVTVASGPATVPAFTATAQTWQVSGSITPASLGSGSTLTLSQSGTTISTATAAGDGTYSFPSVANGTYTLTPAKSGVNFNPTSQSVTVSNGNQTVPVFTATQPSGIALIQKATNGNEATGSNISVAFPSNNTAGNFLIITGTAARPAGTLTIADTAGNTFIPAIGPVTDTAQDVTAYIWYVPSCKGGANTVTLTPATAAALEIHISEWTGLAATSPVDQIASATGTGTTASSGAAPTGVNGELIFGYTFLFNTATAGSGFTPMSLVNGDLDEYQVQSAAGSIAATYTQTSGTWFVLMATFKPAGTVSNPSGSIAGTITPPTAGMTVNLTGPLNGSTSTDGSGNYTFNNLQNGTYTVTPAASGYSFTPPSQSVPITGAAVTGINFTAQTVTTAALAIDVNVSKNNTSALTSITSSKFSTKAVNEVLLALVATDSVASNMTVTGVTGGGLTWSLVQRTNTQGGTSEIWRAFAPAILSSVSVTASLSQSVLGSMTVLSFSGADPTTPIGATGSRSAASGAPTASLTTTRNNSWVVGVGTDISRSTARTVPSNQTLIHQDRASTVGDTFWMQRQNAPTPASGTTVTINDTAPANDSYNLSIAEVLPATTGDGGGTTPPTVAVIAPAPNGYAVSKTTLAASASDNVAVAGVQFMIDGVNVGTELTSAPYYMTWDSTTVSNGTHTLAARARNTANLTSTASITINVDNSGSPATVGSWSSAVSLPTVAVNLLLLKNNKLMFYEDGASATIWDYINNTFTSTPDTADLFCSGHAFLADGRVLVVGGFGGGSSDGIANAEIFDPVANLWTPVPNMSYARWYPTATTLSDGRIIVTAGWNKGPHDNVGIPEVYDPSTNKWTQLTAANNPFESYPFIYQLPDGRLLHIGGSEYATITEALDLGTNTWTTIDSRIIDGASPAMYLPSKFVKAGSASDSQGGSAPVFNTTYVLDMTAPSPAWQQVPSMVYPRSFMNMTVLPDGTVLATGGETDRNGGTIANAVYAAELWSPTTQTWTTMASMHTPREYHSTALLLPDGRVLQSGMGSDFGNVPDEKSAEFYSPPYLFKGARPTISQAPAQISYNTNFFVGTPDAASITKVVLIRNGGVTHFFDQNTRYVPLTFSQASGGLTVIAPVDGRLAPPGYYMLFLVNSNGVPSVAPMVQVGP